MSEYRQNSLIEICVFWMGFFLGRGGGVSVGVQVIESLSFASVIRQTPCKETFYGIRQSRVNELAVLKLKHIIILSTQQRKYETKTFNENFAKKVRTP